MYSPKAITVLKQVRDLLTTYPYLYSWYCNSCDQIGQLVLVVNQINPPQLQHELWLENSSYVQCDWGIILDDYINNKIYSKQLNNWLSLLFSTFGYNQLHEINSSYNVADEYQSYMDFLNAVIARHHEVEVAA